MKVVFNFSRTASAARAVRVAALLIIGLGTAAPVRAETTYWNTRDLLADFFRTSDKVSFRRVELDPAQKERLEHQLGYTLARASYTFFVATSAHGVDGYAFFDEELGQHLPISFAVKLSPTGAVERQEIVAYREARGDEVRDAR